MKMTIPEKHAPFVAFVVDCITKEMSGIKRMRYSYQLARSSVARRTKCSARWRPRRRPKIGAASWKSSTDTRTRRSTKRRQRFLVLCRLLFLLSQERNSFVDSR